MRTDVANKIRNTLFLGLASSVVVFIYLDHQVRISWSAALIRKFGNPDAAREAFLAEFLLASMSVFVCAGVGFFLARRYRLPGMGDIRELRRFVPWLILAGLSASPVAYFLHDRVFLVGAREKGCVEMIPGGIGWSLVFVAYGVLFKEVIFRFGLMTLISGLFRGRRPWLAVGGITVFAAGLSLRELGFAGHMPENNLITLSVFIWALIFNAALGAACVKKGLWGAMALRICVDLRFVLYAVLG